MADVEQKSPRKLSGKGVVLPAAAANNMICKTCSKRVYELEKLVMGDIIYHKTCFRCQTCNSVLKLNNFGAANGKNFCKPHFIEAFKVKGNYSAGFADNDEEEKAKTKKTSDVKPPAEKVANGSNSEKVANGSNAEKVANGSNDIKANSNGNLHADEPAPVPTSVSRTEGADELPAEGTTRQRLALLRQLTEDRQDTAPRTKTSPTEETAPVNVTRNMLKKFESLNASGDAKNQTAASAAEEDRELPAADTTRNLLAKFRSMEDPSRAPPSPQTTAEHHHKTTAVDVRLNVKEEEETAPSDHDATAHTHHTAETTIEDADADDSFLQVKDDASDRGVVSEEVGGSEELELVNDRHEVDEVVEECHSAGEVHHEVHREYEHQDAAHHSHEVHHHDNGHEAHSNEKVDDVADEAKERIRHHDDSDNEVDAAHHEGEGHADNDDM